ncbi:hypothetical protein HELRODRAFT_169817 [Helobdella robusta]|uniref:Uncharacterized protein n=1 Tax=Helobdella robusta TaxID=6412 RepID=T1F2C5_HELRO|nr:hypothetical protein HELRODRAFT_169817 [Helobdella robusta]ESO08087.1 hypothetical protein HELRODRAFT_169817 [Helobdella robusta]
MEPKLHMTTSKARKKRAAKRGFFDDQLTTSFMKEEPSNGKAKKKSSRIRNNKKYPKSYHLGPKLLPTNTDAIRLKPTSYLPTNSAVPSPLIYSPVNLRNIKRDSSTFAADNNQHLSTQPNKTNGSINPNKIRLNSDQSINANNNPMNDFGASSEQLRTGEECNVDFGTWRKPSLATYGFIPAYKRNNSNENTIKNQSYSSSQPRKSQLNENDDRFERDSLKSETELDLTTFFKRTSVANPNIPNTGYIRDRSGEVMKRGLKRSPKCDL